MKNHGFLYDGSQGWVLSPAYDLNPTPADISPRILSTAISFDDPTASLETAFEVAEYFDINPNLAREIAAEVGTAVACWRTEARRFGLTPREIERMESAFEHEDLALALG
jgi:serine/threonine-protein kinase HipA